MKIRSKLKVVLMGAGSLGFGRGAITGLLASKELRKLHLTIVLVDVDREALDTMYQFARLIKDYYDSPADIEAAADRRKALPGANYVVSAVARKRMELWQEDLFVPAVFGFQQTLGENGGIGGAFHALRSTHLILPICRDMEELCPKAFFLNYTNPESRVCLAINRLTRITAVGLCHGAFETLAAVADILEMNPHEIDITVGGINHFHWVLRMQARKNGTDLYPKFRHKMIVKGKTLHPLTHALYRTFGLFPMPGGHPAEYVSFGYDIVGPEWLDRVGKNRNAYWEEKTGRRTYYTTTLQDFQMVVSGKKPLTKALATPWDSDLAPAIIADIALDLKKREISVNVPNCGAIPNLPEDAIVEISAMVDAEGIHPLPVGPLPEGIAAMCRLQMSIQNLLVEAYQTGSRNKLLQALLLDPTVNSIPRAEKVIDELLRTEKNFLPTFK